MEDIFAKIVSRDLPADIVYEDEYTLAFLDNKPTVTGHTLVIPKHPVLNIFDADDETLAHIMHAVRIVAPAVRDAVGAHGVHINSNHGEAAGQIVGRLHLHIIPRHDRSEFAFWPHHEADSREQKEIAGKIREKLGA